MTGCPFLLSGNRGFWRLLDGIPAVIMDRLPHSHVIFKRGSGLDYIAVGDNQSPAERSMLNGIAHFLAKGIRSSPNEGLTIDSAEETQLFSITFLEFSQIHANIGLNPMPEVNANLN